MTESKTSNGRIEDSSMWSCYGGIEEIATVESKTFWLGFSSWLNRILSNSFSSWPNRRDHCSLIEDPSSWPRRSWRQDIIAIELKTFQLEFIMVESNRLPWLNWSLSYLASSWPNQRGAIVESGRPSWSNLKLSNSASSWLNSRLSILASSWPNRRDHRGQVEGFPTQLRQGQIGEVIMPESKTL